MLQIVMQLAQGFRSTPPRGERPARRGCARSTRRFDPRPRAGSDHGGQPAAGLFGCFDPRPRAGSDARPALGQAGRTSFDPRPRAGSDRASAYTMRRNSKSAFLREPVALAPYNHRNITAAIWQMVEQALDSRGANLPGFSTQIEVRAASARLRTKVGRPGRSRTSHRHAPPGVFHRLRAYKSAANP